MVFFLQLLQKCQIGIERLDAAEAKEAEWVAEREQLQASLAAKEAMLVEEAGRNAGFVTDFEESQVLVEHLREELKDEETQNTHLASELDDFWTVVARLEEDLQDAKGANKRLLSQRNLAQGSLEMASRGKWPRSSLLWRDKKPGSRRNSWLSITPLWGRRLAD